MTSVPSQIPDLPERASARQASSGGVFSMLSAALTNYRTRPAFSPADPRERAFPTSQAQVARRNRHVSRLRSLARLMDTRYRIPGTEVRFGLDPVLGLIPGIGDGLGLAVSGYALWVGHHLGMPRRALARMLANLAVDSVVGAIPLVGDVFDVAFQANRRNLRLVEQHVRRTGLGSESPHGDAPPSP